MLDSLWTLSGARLVCHCRITQSCHADTIIEAFRCQYPYAFDRSSHSSIPPNSQVLNYLAKLREEPPEDEGSSADEGAPPAGSGWRGVCSPMMIGVGYTSREFCDGQTLASPGTVGCTQTVNLGEQCQTCSWTTHAESEQRSCSWNSPWVA